MKKINRERWGVWGALVGLGAAAGGVSSLLGGCSEESTLTLGSGDAGTKTDAGTLPPPKTDGGGLGSLDGGADSDMFITFVHATAAVPVGVRFCLSALGQFPPVEGINKPLPAKADAPKGLLFGTGGGLAIPKDVASALPTLEITAYGIPVQDDGRDGTKTCAELIPDLNDKSKWLVPAVKFPPIPRNTFKSGKSYFVIAMGCPAPEGGDGGSPPLTARECGGDPGNLRLEVVEVDTNPPAAGSVGFQFLHLSPQLHTELGDAGVYPSVTYPAADAGGAADAGDGGTADAGNGGAWARLPLGTDVKFEPKPKIQPSSAAASKEVLSAIDKSNFQVHLDPGAVNGPGFFDSDGLPWGLPLSDIVTVSSATPGATAASFFKGGKAYTLVVVGDPKVDPPGTPDAGAPGPTFLRVVALPNRL